MGQNGWTGINVLEILEPECFYDWIMFGDGGSILDTHRKLSLEIHHRLKSDMHIRLQQRSQTVDCNVLPTPSAEVYATCGSHCSRQDKPSHCMRLQDHPQALSRRHWYRRPTPNSCNIDLHVFFNLQSSTIYFLIEDALRSRTYNQYNPVP